MAGILRTDTIQNSNTSTIITQTNSTTITIGTTGQTVALASGASQSGFGRAGSVNWDTTPKTTGFTAVSGNGYFIDTTSVAITINLPATPAAGDIVAISDYANTAATNNITVGRNGSNIDGNAVDGKIEINGQVYTLVYVDATEGWKTVGQTFNQITTAAFVAATGGTITTCGDYKIHSFTGPGTFTVTCAGNPSGSNSVEYLVVAGGGAGGGCSGGGAGGGAGGLRFASSSIAPLTYPAKPLAAPANLPVTVQGYPITVGAGAANPSGSGSDGPGTPGSPSVFSTITSAGGGSAYATCGVPFPNANISGGSGAGSQSSNGSTTRDAGTGNTPPVSPSQGQPGGRHNPYPAGCSGAPTINGGGGGGAIQAGGQNPEYGGDGGGFPTAFGSNGQSCGSFRYYAGGGAGICRGGAVSHPGGLGGGGTSSGSPGGGGAGTANTGGGGAGARGTNTGPLSGGSGIVVIRYKYQ